MFTKWEHQRNNRFGDHYFWCNSRGVQSKVGGKKVMNEGQKSLAKKRVPATIKVQPPQAWFPKKTTTLPGPREKGLCPGHAGN